MFHRQVYDRSICDSAWRCHCTCEYNSRDGGRWRRIFVCRWESRWSNRSFGEIKRVWLAVHSTDSQGHSRCWWNITFEVSRSGLSNRRSSLGTWRSRIARRHSTESPNRWFTHRYSRSEKRRFRSVHVLGKKQARSQCTTKWRSQRDRSVIIKTSLRKRKFCVLKSFSGKIAKP